MMHCRYREQAGDCNMRLVYIPVRKDNIIVALINASLDILAQLVKRITQVAAECHREFNGIETFIANIAQYVKLSVV